MIDAKMRELIEESSQEIADAAGKIAHAIMPPSVGQDEIGGYVGSLGEAVMGVTAGLVRIADAIGDLADAIREGKRQEDD